MNAKGGGLGKGGRRAGAGRPVGAKDKKQRVHRATPRAFLTVDSELYIWISCLAKNEGISVRSWAERALRDSAEVQI